MKATLLCSLVFASCASADAGSRPVIASTMPYEDIIAVQYDDKDGVFIEMGAFRDILVAHEMDRGELRNQAAKAEAKAAFHSKHSEEMSKQAQKLAWGSVYGPVLGAGIGAFTVGALWALVEIFKAAIEVR